MDRPPSPALLPHLRRAKDRIDTEYDQEIDLADLARCAGYSRYHFLRSFRAVYGETPQRYLTRRRVERAKDLLRSANLTITEICHEVGFASLGTFSTRFTELVGMPPSEYRAKAVAEDGPPAVPGCFVMMWTRPHPAAGNGSD